MPRYLTPEQIQWIHRRVIETTGGSSHVRDQNLVQSSAVRPSAGAGQRDTYRTIPEKAAALLESLVLYHPFVDGNKRSALVAAGIFLERNGWRLDLQPADTHRFVTRLAAGATRFQDVVRWVERRSRRVRAGKSARPRRSPR
jgi:death-on-curing protein